MQAEQEDKIRNNLASIWSVVVPENSVWRYVFQILRDDHKDPCVAIEDATVKQLDSLIEGIIEQVEMLRNGVKEKLEEIIQDFGSEGYMGHEGIDHELQQADADEFQRIKDKLRAKGLLKGLGLGLEALHNLAALLTDKGGEGPEEALPLLEEALVIEEKAYGPDHFEVRRGGRGGGRGRRPVCVALCARLSACQCVCVCAYLPACGSPYLSTCLPALPLPSPELPSPSPP